MPVYLANTFKDSGAPKEVSTKEERLKWLDVARNEMLSALKNSENRLLTAYLSVHQKTIRRWSRDPKDAMRALNDKSVGDQVCPQERWP